MEFPSLENRVRDMAVTLGSITLTMMILSSTGLEIAKYQEKVSSTWNWISDNFQLEESQLDENLRERLRTDLDALIAAGTDGAGALCSVAPQRSKEEASASTNGAEAEVAAVGASAPAADEVSSIKSSTSQKKCSGLTPAKTRPPLKQLSVTKPV